jgi:hypothetical protein
MQFRKKRAAASANAGEMEKKVIGERFSVLVSPLKHPAGGYEQ